MDGYKPMAVVTANPSGGVGRLAALWMKSIHSCVWGSGRTAKHPAAISEYICKLRESQNKPNLSGLYATYSSCAASDFSQRLTNSAGVRSLCHSFLIDGAWFLPPVRLLVRHVFPAQGAHNDRSLNADFIHVLEMVFWCLGKW